MSGIEFCTLAQLFGSYSQVIALIIITTSMLFLVIWRLVNVDALEKDEALKVKFITGAISLLDIILLPAMVGPNVTGCGI